MEYTLPSDSTDSLASESDDFDFAASLIIFSETKALDLTSRFRKDADAYYVEAKRSTVATMAQIPFWMYGVLVVLGWNEAMLVLFNPLYFTMLLIGLVSAYVFPMFMRLQLVDILSKVVHHPTWSRWTAVPDLSNSWWRGKRKFNSNKF